MSERYNFVLKIIQLGAVCACLVLLLQYTSVQVPRWLWMFYCLDSVTYIVILAVIILCYTMQTEIQSSCQALDFYFTALGIPLYMTGAIGGIIQKILVEPEDADNGPIQLYLAILLGVISLLMLVNVALSMYFFRKKRMAQLGQASGMQRR